MVAGSNPVIPTYLSPESSITRLGIFLLVYPRSLLSEGSRCNARRISRRWAVLMRTAHCRDNSLAAADTALSQQRKKGR